MTDKVKQFLINLIQDAKAGDTCADKKQKFMSEEEFHKELNAARQYLKKHPEKEDLDIVWGFDLPEADGISPIERYVQPPSQIDKIAQFKKEIATKDLENCFGLSPINLK